MGKLVGTALGAIVGVALGDIWWMILPFIGFAGGYAWDKQTTITADDLDAIGDPALRNTLTNDGLLRFARSMAALFVVVAQADGEMTRDEAAAIREFFSATLGFTSAELEQVRQALQEARAHAPDLDVLLFGAREKLSDAERSLLLYALARVAAADHAVNAEEYQVLTRIAHGLGLDPDVAGAMLVGHDSPRARAAGGGFDFKKETRALPSAPIPGDPYSKLGISPAADEAAIKQAYRQLAQKLHPDKVQALGPKAVELAGRAFAEVSEAYEVIRRERGF
ncbi:MAG: molecular chaperone DjiA [Deltaproteobacteria bacterium]|nr:molecular chaperone DjiA [Deltaproteobacteria bacterium]